MTIDRGDRWLGWDNPAPEPLETPSRALAAGSSAVTYGIDVHPIYQAGLDIEAVAREGFGFLAVKASQGTNMKWADIARSWCDRADAAGMVTWVYHYLTTDDVTSQARTAAAASHGRPVMVDVETGGGNADTVRGFLQACESIGQRVSLSYLPRWYWQQIGSPSLAGLPPLVASHYVAGTGYASSLYQNVPDTWWSSYGGLPVAILQFTDKATVAGKQVDANVYRGTLDELRGLVYGAAAPTPTPTPTELPVLREGMSSALIWRLQLFMNDNFRSYSSISAGPGPTSRYGPQTSAVIRDFQTRCRIDADGVVGPETWAQLIRFGFHP